MDAFSPEQRTQRLQDAEQALQQQLDRVYALIDEGKAEAILQLEFKRYVEQLSKKYNVLFAGLEMDKSGLEQADYQTHAQQLRDQYAQDVKSAATAIDGAIAKRGEKETDNR